MCLMVGVGIEPTYAAFQTAANPSQLSDQALMFVEGFEPSTSGFVDQRSQFPLSYTNKVRAANQGGRTRTCVGLLPRQVGSRCPTP